jgi:hypothetical protein
MSKMTSQAAEIIEIQMLNSQHKSLSFTKYKEQSRILVRVCDFIDLFASVN